MDKIEIRLQSIVLAPCGSKGKFEGVLKENFSKESFFLDKISYCRHNEGGHIVINGNLMLSERDAKDQEERNKYKIVNEILDETIKDYDEMCLQQEREHFAEHGTYG
tara:strand:+ start:3347 stop:3667 length:321 start_codon:yes stop_codon:yes gene_type:complete